MAGLEKGKPRLGRGWGRRAGIQNQREINDSQTREGAGQGFEWERGEGEGSGGGGIGREEVAVRLVHGTKEKKRHPNLYTTATKKC